MQLTVKHNFHVRQTYYDITPTILEAAPIKTGLTIAE